MEVLGNLGPDKAEELVRAGQITDFYVFAGPGPAAEWNEQAWPEFARRVEAAGGRCWLWWVDRGDQLVDLAAVKKVLAEWKPTPFGSVLNIEAESKGKDLDVLCAGMVKIGKPWLASLAGFEPDHNLFDHRQLARAEAQQEWQAYFDSGEGSTPAACVSQLHRCREIEEGKEYRARVGKGYGFGRFARVDGQPMFLYYPTGRWLLGPKGRLGDPNVHWPPFVVTDPTLRDTRGNEVGELMGLAPYKKIRATLDVTRGAVDKHTPAEWTAIAASARAPGYEKRGVSIYLLEVIAHTHPEVVEAIARGGGRNVL